MISQRIFGGQRKVLSKEFSHIIVGAGNLFLLRIYGMIVMLCLYRQQKWKIFTFGEKLMRETLHSIVGRLRYNILHQILSWLKVFFQFAPETACRKPPTIGVSRKPLMAL